jgi:DNA polymerase-3 subunit epsilon
MYLFYDVETSGLPDYKAPSEAPHQPHIVQMGAILVDEHYNELKRLDAIVRPEGWEIPAEVAAIHGITNERALAEGRREDQVMAEFTALWMQATKRIAFNDPFDARLVRIFYKRTGQDAMADKWHEFPVDCAMKRATPLCALPPTAKMLAVGRRHYKNPKLEEAVRILLQEEMVGAHSAIIDVEYTIRVYRHMVPPPAPTLLDDVQQG